MDALPAEVRDLTILRRIIFAVTHLPRDLPQYWTIVAEFACPHDRKLQPESVKLAGDNLQYINKQAFATDIELQRELHRFNVSTASTYPLGIALLSKHMSCKACGGKLKICSDRPSHVTVYTEAWGTVSGTHYHKFCQNFYRGCKFRQYYGYSSNGTCTYCCY